MTENVVELNGCLCCLSNKLEIIMDLKEQPLANNFHNNMTIQEQYPLKLLYCAECYHCQLSCAIDPTILFTSYKYVSGTSETGLKFFNENANFINAYKKGANRNVLDIACNDGSQLNYFKELGWKTYGIDPAKNLEKLSTKNGHSIVCDFWNLENAKKFPKMDAILAQNVFAHTKDVDNFLQACKSIMNDNTSLFIQTSQKNMILNNEFDTIYHEHISFFNTNSMNTLVERNGLVLNNVFENDIHGGSYIFEIKTTKDCFNYNVDHYIKTEQLLGLYNEQKYLNFHKNAASTLGNLYCEINNYKNNGYKCIGFGAAAKGQTVICFGNIQLDYIIDENPLKIGLFSPKLNIPIVNLDHLKYDNSKKIVIVILAWNFSGEIIKKIEGLNKKGEIVIIKKYFPLLEKVIFNKTYTKDLPNEYPVL